MPMPMPYAVLNPLAAALQYHCLDSQWGYGMAMDAWRRAGGGVLLPSEDTQAIRE